MALLIASSVATSMAGAVGDVPLTREDADRMLGKIHSITLNSVVPASDPRLTPIMEAEVNAYLKFHAAELLPPGVVDPTVGIVGDGRLSGRAVVDLDKLPRAGDRAGSGGVFDPMSYLTGQLPVSTTGVLHTENGIARLELETAEIAGIPVPITMVEQLVSTYSRTPENARGLDLNDPFPLPMEIVEIRVGQGEAVVVQ